LSAVEKRDLALKSRGLRGKLDVILGVATPSLDEAVWLCKQAAHADCRAVLLMPPFYFKEAECGGIRQWFLEVFDKSPIGVIVYNFPQRTGIDIDLGLLAELAAHPNCVGVKDSSGNEANLAAYRQAVPSGKLLFVGNETLLVKALHSGWSGTISGAANCLPSWLSQIVKQFFEGKLQSAEEKFKLCLPAIEALRSRPQPALNKVILAGWRVLPEPHVRLPLTPVRQADAESVARLLKETLGMD